jgi:hypothetical protein
MVQIIKNLASLGVQELDRGKKINCALYSSSIMLITPRFGLPGHIMAAGKKEGSPERAAIRFYIEIGDGEVVGQGKIRWQRYRYLQAALIQIC